MQCDTLSTSLFQIMLEIIHLSNLQNVLKFQNDKERVYACIVLDKAAEVYPEVLKAQGIKKIEVEELLEEEKLSCEKEYIDTIAALGAKYNSLNWWANPLSEKNEYISSHYKNLCLYYRLIKTLDKYTDAALSVFLICNNEILEQLKIYCLEKKIRITSVKDLKSIISLSTYNRTSNYLHCLFFILKNIYKKFYIAHSMSHRIRKQIACSKDYFVIRTWLDKNFKSGSEIYNDVFFGRLPAYVRKHGYKLLILSGILNNYKKVIDRIKDGQESQDVLIIPEEYFIRYSDFLLLLGYLVSKKIKIKETVFFKGIDVTDIYRRELARGYSNAGYLSNIWRYLIARRFAEAVTYKAYIQTFENYAWEKMTILGIRENKDAGLTYGFQHAFISRNSFKYFPGRLEKEIIPLPDKIITMGRETKEIMQRYGSYKDTILKTGCALRQEYLGGLKPFERRRLNKVLVPLTMVVEESIQVLKYLCDSDLPQTGINVVIRCHPFAPFESLKKHSSFSIADNITVSCSKSVREDLNDSDMVIYTWTTVAIEALRLGLPVIYLDILGMMVDPLFRCDALKRSVSKPEELLPAIESLYSLDNDTFYKEQQKAQEYLQQYFTPVTEENLSVFLPEQKAA